MHSTASRYVEELTHVRKPNEPTLMQKIGLMTSPSCPTTCRIVPSPPVTTMRSAAAPNSASDCPDHFPAIRAVYFSNRTEIEKRPNSWEIALISSATPE